MSRQPWAKSERARPPGYRTLDRWLGRETEKAALFLYYGHELWMPKRAVRWAEGSYHAPAWAIDSAKSMNANRKQREADEAERPAYWWQADDDEDIPF